MAADEDTDTEWDEEFYECEDDDEMDDEYFDTQDFQDNELPPLVPRDSKAKKFPPPLDNYVPNDPSSHPRIGFNEGRDIACLQCQQEVNYFREKVGMKGDGMEGLFKKLFGEDSELYARFKKMGIRSLEDYLKFLAAFFLECRFSITYERLVNDPDVNTSSYMDLDRYKAIWRILDNYNKQENYSSRAWEEVESALNQTLHDLFVPKHDEFKTRLAYDDDKQWYNHFIRIKDMLLGVDSKLKRCRCSFSFWISCVCALS